MNEYTLVLNQYTSNGKVKRTIIIVAKSEEEAWKELHNGIYKFKDAKIIKEESITKGI